MIEQIGHEIQHPHHNQKEEIQEYPASCLPHCLTALRGTHFTPSGTPKWFQRAWAAKISASDILDR